MADVKAHYDNLLAPYYSWIFGGSEQKLRENRNFFSNHGIQPVLSGVAMDLGAGCGFQSIPLAEAGFKVIAIDISHVLLADLKKSAGNLPIETIEDNLQNFLGHHPENTELIVCMGDTLTHLETLDEVQLLFKNVYLALEGNGRLVITFRDLTFELKGLDRFIPVRSESNLIFTCFLEYEKEHVKVHDLIYGKTKDQWQVKKGFYRKLRIPPDWTRECLLKIGFKVEEFDIQNGMVTLIACRRYLLMLFYRLKGPKALKQHAEIKKKFYRNFSAKGWPKVTIQLPIFNERYVVERLIRSISRFDYPRELLEIQILDDSTDDTMDIAQAMAGQLQDQGFDIQYVHRDHRTGFKAGALKQGLKTAKGKLVGIFDADFIPGADFLKETVPYFSDPKIGMLQTRWGHINGDYSLLTRAQAMGIDGHFGVEQASRAWSGFFMNFNGTAERYRWGLAQNNHRRCRPRCTPGILS